MEKTQHEFFKNRQFYMRPNFPHIEAGIVGVAGKPFVTFDHLFETQVFETLHQEIVMGLSQVEHFDHGLILGEIPPEFQEKKPERKIKLESEIFGDIEKHDPTGIHRKNLDALKTTQQKRRYCYFAMGGYSPWYGIFYLLRNDFLKKTSLNTETIEWEPGTEYFPQLKSFIESLKENVFDSIGRALFFISYPNVETITHRDYLRVDHKDHCINFFFTKGRPAYIYDEINKVRHYLPQDSKCYFFNNRDYHGVDAEPEFRYTLRVDGTFKKEIAEQMGLKDGWLKV